MASKLDEGIAVYGAGVISRHLQSIRGEIAGVRESSDIEYVHRMRVATRRMRSALPLFWDSFPDKHLRAWVYEIKAITKALGSARDTDVQIEAIHKAVQDLDNASSKAGLRRLEMRLHQRREILQVDVIRALDGLESSGILEDMDRRLAPLLARKDNLYLYTPALYERGFITISADLRAFLAYEQYVHQPECITELHAMRIAAKQLRYTMEAFSPIYPGEIKPSLQVVRKFQEQLGDIHDYDVWINYLPEFIEKERGLTQEFFGHLRGFNRIETGIMALLERQKDKREQTYQEFTVTWENQKSENAWRTLLSAIQIPYFQGEQPESTSVKPAGPEPNL